MDSFLWLLSRLRPYLPLILLSLVGSVLQSGGATAITLLIKGVIDDVFILKDKEKLLETVFLLLLAAFAMQAGFFISKYLVSLSSEKTLMDIRREIFKKLLKLPYAFFVRNSPGDFISRVVSDVDKLRQVLVDHIPTLLREPLVALALIGVLIYRDFLLTVLLLIVIPIMGFTVRYFGAKKGTYMKRTQEGMSELTQVLSQTIQGLENIKLFLAQRSFLKSFEGFNRRVYRASVKTELYIAGNTALNYITGYLVVGGVLFYGGYRIVEGSLTPGDFISYLTALFMVQPPLLNTQKALMNLKGSFPVINRLRELLFAEEETSGTLKLVSFREGIEFRGLNVFLEDREVLKDINLKIPKGEKLGIVGRTGSGKSTLVRVLPLLVSYQGHALLDGIELKEYELTSLRSCIGLVTQEPFLINGSVRENLLIAKPDATEKEMEEALRLALCDFVFRLEKGLDTPVGERGYALSGGERQRLSIARLFLKNPQIVILDEATSALDMSTEKTLLENLFDFFRDRTMLVIAHRLSNISLCNRIIVLKEGRLVEEGSFYSLLERRGEFFRIFRQGKVV